VVARYQLAGSNDANGLIAQRRYQREANLRMASAIKPATPA
jgi:hypothetical protein